MTAVQQRYNGTKQGNCLVKHTEYVAAVEAQRAQRAEDIVCKEPEGECHAAGAWRAAVAAKVQAVDVVSSAQQIDLGGSIGGQCWSTRTRTMGLYAQA